MYVMGDIFEWLDQQTDENVQYCMPHVVNDKGRMASGFVVPLMRRWPKVKNQYVRWHAGLRDADSGTTTPFRRGEVQFVHVEVTPRVTVCNMVAQTLGGKRPLYYNDLAACMDTVARAVIDQERRDNKVKIIAPLFGSGLAGGDWKIIRELIEDCWLRRSLDVSVFVLPENEDIIQ